ncbi:MAG: putative Protein kinase superfamily protein [Streblomastix strix]|uniref:non-specific serine/threonine protein kinase n=1 Tax=Streblomastix strix TaxID=222440 RepID=A0A5J4V2L3_9EUKA|nr:MAG: putative Protein kinase superfamily protein [Streblomastix strix]
MSKEVQPEDVIVGHGAEAIAVRTTWGGKLVVKKIRVKKNYRLEELDIKLRKHRTNTEAKCLRAAMEKAKINVPAVLHVDNKECFLILEYIQGTPVRMILSQYEGNRHIQYEEVKMYNEDEEEEEDDDDDEYQNDKDDEENIGNKRRRVDNQDQCNKGVASFIEKDTPSLSIQQSSSLSIQQSSSLSIQQSSSSSSSSSLMQKSVELPETVNSDDSSLLIATQIGQAVAHLHDSQIIHGDLTTSNMMIQDQTNQLFLIDFGLSFMSNKEEDKAVDLNVLERALLATHPRIGPFWNRVLESYSSTSTHSKEVLERLEKVKQRGRKRSMAG